MPKTGVPPTLYERWAASLPLAPQCRVRSLALIGAAPRGSGLDLAEYLIGLNDEDLRACWAALILDFAMDMDDPHELARPLLVVKHRLAARRSR